MPEYAHLPLLLKPDGNGKLSKRDGDRLGFPVFPLQWQDPGTGEISSGYRELGYYPDAFVNMLAFLGWNPGTDQELFSMNELIEAFSFEHVHKAGARFDPEKAKWFNEQYLRKQNNTVLANSLKRKVIETFSINDGDIRVSESFLEGAVELLKDRVQLEQEMIDKGSYLFVRPHSYDQQVLTKKFKPGLESFFVALSKAFSDLEDVTATGFDTVIKATATGNQVKPGEIMQLLRVFISGQSGGVDLIGMLQLLGKEEVCNRLQAGLSYALKNYTAAE
jgi:glutamyl-tRNA synthetase